MSRRGEKTLDKRYRKIRNRIIACAILILLAIIFWHYISDLHAHIDLLAKYNHQQNIEMNNLHHQIDSLKEHNARLEGAVVYQHSVIDNFSKEPQITYTTHPETSSIKVQFTHNPSHVNTYEPSETNASLMNYSAIIVTTMTMVGGILKQLIPSF